jgi:hypothetical protein
MNELTRKEPDFFAASSNSSKSKSFLLALKDKDGTRRDVRVVPTAFVLG